MGYAWNALSYQEKISQGSTLKVLGLSILFVFLILAALYESWSLPFSVLLSTPIAVLGALLGLLWGGLARIFLVHHVTWSVNSVCHLWGRKPYPSHDESRNNFLFGILALGEGWHNNHHAFPTSARHGLRWWQVDMTYWVIRLMSWVKLAASLKLPRQTPASSFPAEASRPRNGPGAEGGHDSVSPSIQRRGPSVAFTSAVLDESPSGERRSRWA
jgi:fatty-acid desaturase